MHSTTQRAGRPRLLFAWASALGGAILLLGGCGGGGGINGTSTTSEGFRIVPAGGTVSPPITGTDSTISSLTFVTQPDVVATGVQVTVASTGLPPNLAGQVGPAATEAFQITLSPTLAAFNNPVSITLNVPAGSLTSDQQATAKIYTYDAAAATWLALPGKFTLNGTTGTVTGTLVFPADKANLNSPVQNSLSDSGIYVVASDSAPLPPTTL